MKYGIISDIHSNIHALASALEKIKSVNVDKILCLGDVVGYNAFPHECISMIRKEPLISDCIQGNHDELVTNIHNIVMQLGASKDALDGAIHSSLTITDDDKKWLSNLPVEKIIDDPNVPFLITHSFPLLNPWKEKWNYILNDFDARNAYDCMKYNYNNIKICLFGHSHILSLGIRNKNNGKLNTVFYNGRTKIQECSNNITSKFKNSENIIIDIKGIMEDYDNMFLFNAGSVGQPRHNNEIGFGILDTDKYTYEYKTFQYDVQAAQNAIIKVGYSDTIADRLIND